MQTDPFIKNLTRNLEPRASIASLPKSLVLWLVAAFALSCVAVQIHGLRPEMALMLKKGSYSLELFSALATGILAAGAAIHMRIPGNKVPKRTLGAFGLLWVVSLILHNLSLSASIASFHPQAELACVSAVLMFGVLPAVILITQVRRGACTEPKLTLALVAIAVTATGAAFLSLVCGNDGLIHRIVGHASPLFIITPLSWAVGRKILRW